MAVRKVQWATDCGIQNLTYDQCAMVDVADIMELRRAVCLDWTFCLSGILRI